MNNTKIIFPTEVGRYPKELLETTTRRYAPMLSNSTGKTETGLSLAEIDRIFPTIVNDLPSSPQFREKVEDWFNNLYLNVPYFTGYTLNIGLDENKLPLVPADYCLYHIMLKDDTVAVNPQDAVIDSTYRYKLIDSAVIKTAEVNKYNVEKEAGIVLAKLVSLPESSISLLRYIVLVNKDDLGLTIDEINNLDRIELEMNLSNLSKSAPLKIVEDYKNQTNLKILGHLELFISFNLINIEGEDYYYEGKKLATSKKGMFDVLKNDSTLYSTLISKTKVERGVFNYFKTVEKEEVVPA